MSSSVGRLVTGKARRYLRTSTILFTLALMLVGTFLVVVENEYQRVRHDFVDNDAVHLVQVTRPVSEGGADGYLRFRDVSAIEDAARRGTEGTGFDVSVEYSLGFGISDADDNPHFLYGIDGHSGRLLGLPALQDDTVYAKGPVAGDRMTLKIPMVEVEQGGMTSAATSDRTFDARGGVPSDGPLDALGGSDPQALYANGATFRDIVSASYDTSWDDFRKQYDQENIYGTQVIRSVYVYVDQLDDVVPVARSLTAAGFSTGYTLKAFDDLAGSLRASSVVGAAAILAAFLGCFGYILLAFNAYLRVSHKDLAILKHFGFSDRQVARMYAGRAARLLGVVGAVVTGYLAVLGAIVLRGAALVPTLINVAVCGALLGLLYACIALVVLRRHVRLDVLTLLRVDREFE